MRWLRLLILSALFLGAATANHDQVFVNHRVYFVDADCYSRMTRVQHVMEHPFARIAHHDFENYPEGTDPHTTAPMDWVIAALAAAFTPFTKNALDLAGAWISPLLGLATLILLWAWSEQRKLPYRTAMLLLLAVSPMIAQAFKLGRPDHQSLLVLLLATGIAAEISQLRDPTRRMAITWGIAWGLALWTSLYEPVIVLGIVLLARAAALRTAFFSRTRIPEFATLGVVLAVALIFDGWRIHAQPAAVATYFPNWSRSIGELASLSPFSSQFVGWIGWLAPLLPFLLAWRLIRTRDSVILLPLLLLVAAYALTCWQLRWGSFLVLFAAMALPFALGAIPSKAFAWTAFGISLLPIASQWDALLFPDAARQAALDESKIDYELLRDLSDHLVSDKRMPVLAPWWLSPPIVYWSGQPCVAGSSHESLAGIADTARFYLDENGSVAREILERRGVRYVVAYEPSRVLGTSQILLSQPAQRDSLGAVLYETPILAPSWLRPVYSNRYFRVYEFRP